MEEIQAKVIQIISEQLGKDESEIKMNSHFIEDLDADSLDTVELVMALEEEFGVDIHLLGFRPEVSYRLLNQRLAGRGMPSAFPMVCYSPKSR